MSYTARRKRHMRQIRQEMQTLAQAAGQQSWQEFCQIVNTLRFTERLRTAWHVVWGTLS